MVRKFVSWAAVSSLPQAKKVSNEEQLKTNREHVARHGGEIVAELVVPGESRSIVLFEDACRRIPAYAQLHQLIKEKAFDVLIYLDRSRLGRTASLSMAVTGLCQEAGILCYEVDNPPASLDAPRGYDDDILGAIKSVNAQLEIKKFMARSAMGMVGRVKSGKMPSAPRYGYWIRYVQVGAKLEPVYEIDEAKASVIRRIFEMYLAGRGTTTIADALNADGIPTPSGKQIWTPIMVKTLLLNCWCYAGYAELNRYSKTGRDYVRAPGNWQPIIDEDTLQRSIKEREARVHNRALVDTPHLFSGVFYCDVCGYTMTVARQLPRYRRYFFSMRCQRHRPSTYIAGPKAESGLRRIIEGLRDSGVEAALDDEASMEAEVRAQMQHAVKALARLDDSLRRADDAFVAGVMDAERYKRQVEKLRGQIVSEQKELNRLELLLQSEQQRSNRRVRLEEVVSEGLAMLEHSDVAAANAWLRAHLRIWVANGEVTRAEWL